MAEPALRKNMNKKQCIATIQCIETKQYISTCVKDYHELKTVHLCFVVHRLKCEKIKWIGIRIPAMKWPIFSMEELDHYSSVF